MNPTKIKLSTTEFSLVTNPGFILTKNAVIEKVYALFGQMATVFVDELATNKWLPKEILATNPKIAKGENYQGLPWVMLDYPRLFNKQDVFAVRVLFWWGNFISITLQLSGKYQQDYQQQIIQNLASSTTNNWQLCGNTDVWQHHFQPNNYKAFSSFTNEELGNLPFIKLAQKIPLQEWDDIDIFLIDNFKNLLQLLATQTVK